MMSLCLSYEYVYDNSANDNSFINAKRKNIHKNKCRSVSAKVMLIIIRNAKASYLQQKKMENCSSKERFPVHFPQQGNNFLLFFP